jgi:hypothetical protein
VTVTASVINPLNSELYPISHLLALLRAHPIFHVNRIRININCLFRSFLIYISQRILVCIIYLICTSLQPFIHLSLEPFRTLQPFIHLSLEPFRSLQPIVHLSLEPFRSLQPFVHLSLEPFRSLQPFFHLSLEPFMSLQPSIHPSVPRTL